MQFNSAKSLLNWYVGVCKHGIPAWCPSITPSADHIRVNGHGEAQQMRLIDQSMTAAWLHSRLLASGVFDRMQGGLSRGLMLIFGGKQIKSIYTGRAERRHGRKSIEYKRAEQRYYERRRCARQLVIRWIESSCVFDELIRKQEGTAAQQ